MADALICDFCGVQFQMERYGEGDCSACGAEYEYEEGRRVKPEYLRKQLQAYKRKISGLRMALCECMGHAQDKHLQHGAARKLIANAAARGLDG